MKRGLLLLCVLALTGCDVAQPNLSMENETGTDQGRFRVQRVGVFEDNLAYNNKRGIYILIDKKTDKQYVGISGVGISELGSHTEGENSTDDER